MEGATVLVAEGREGTEVTGEVAGGMHPARVAKRINTIGFGIRLIELPPMVIWLISLLYCLERLSI